MENKLTIQFLICTINERIVQIPSMLLAPTSGVSYLVSWQMTRESLIDAMTQLQIQEALAFLDQRSDVHVIKCQSRGLSKNRNNALSKATGDLLVIADDDCIYSSDSIFSIYQAFKQYPDASIIQMMIHDYLENPIHQYPDYSYDYASAPRGTYISSCELVLRRSSCLPHFDERFGIGTYLGCGEEEVFVYRAHSAGLKVYFVPLVLVKTDGATTGTRFVTQPSVQRAKGAVLSVIYGPFSAVLRCFKFVFIVLHCGFFHKIACFIQTLKGICYEVYTRHSIL